MDNGLGIIFVISIFILATIGLISIIKNDEITIVSDVKICVEERKPNFYYIKACKYSEPFYTINNGNIIIKNLDYINK